MKRETAEVIRAAIAYDKGDAKRINHFLKVYAYAKAIGELTGISADVQEPLELAAVLHDIGIHVCEIKYGSCTGPEQQLEGPPIAKELLTRLDYPQPVIERTCYLISHHHTYQNIDGIDYQILIEADFLVNIDEDNMEQQQIESIGRKYFKTAVGLEFLKHLFGT